MQPFWDIAHHEIAKILIIKLFPSISSPSPYTSPSRTLSSAYSFFTCLAKSFLMTSKFSKLTFFLLNYPLRQNCLANLVWKVFLHSLQLCPSKKWWFVSSHVLSVSPHALSALLSQKLDINKNRYFGPGHIVDIKKLT